MYESNYIKNIKGLYLLYKNIKVNNRLYNEHFKSSMIEKLYKDTPYQHIKKCFCNYNCNDCWKFTCESCKKGFNDGRILCGDRKCYKYLKHVTPKIFEDTDKDVFLIVDNYHLTFNQANVMEKNIKDNEKLVFIKLLL